jgi:hypothetical protein
MTASEVKQYGGGRWVKCGPDDPGAVEAGASGSPMLTYTDPPAWLAGSDYHRMEKRAQAAESYILMAVAMPKGDDPDRTNAQWAMASPGGQLTMTIHNPEAFGYVRAGEDYRVTIERIRGPREKPASSAAPTSPANYPAVVTINTNTYSIDGPTLTYGTICSLAGISSGNQPTVTYYYEGGVSGIIGPTDTLDVEDGTVIDVAVTNRA